MVIGAADLASTESGLIATMLGAFGDVDVDKDLGSRYSAENNFNSGTVSILDDEKDAAGMDKAPGVVGAESGPETTEVTALWEVDDVEGGVDCVLDVYVLCSMTVLMTNI